MTKYVCVISKSGKVLMPTKRFGKVRKLLKLGKAKAVCLKPFTIKLQYESKEYLQPLILGIDPGGKEIGISVRKKNGEIIELGHLETRSCEVSKKLAERKMYRQGRRRHDRLKRQRRAKKNGTYYEGIRNYKVFGTEKGLNCKLIKRLSEK